VTRLELLREKREEINRIAAKHSVYGIRVFGSVARGEAGPESDVDFLVEVASVTTPWFPAVLVVDLEDLLGRGVEVVTNQGLNPDQLEHVLAKAVPV